MIRVHGENEMRFHCLIKCNGWFLISCALAKTPSPRGSMCMWITSTVLLSIHKRDSITITNAVTDTNHNWLPHSKIVYTNNINNNNHQIDLWIPMQKLFASIKMSHANLSAPCKTCGQMVFSFLYPSLPSFWSHWFWCFATRLHPIYFHIEK